MKRTTTAVLFLAVLQLLGMDCYAGPLNFTVSKVSGFSGPFNVVYQVFGGGVSLDIKKDPSQTGAFAKYDVEGNMFGSQLGFDNAIKYDSFGNSSAVMIAAKGIYAKLSKQGGWPGDMEIETRLGNKADIRAVAVFFALANYLPRIPEATNPFGENPTMKFKLRKFGNDILVEGTGLSNFRLQQNSLGPRVQYAAKGSGFGKNFDGPDKLEIEIDNTFQSRSEYRVRGCGIDLTMTTDSFGGDPRLTVQGTPGDSTPLAAFVMGFAGYTGK